MRYYIKSKLLKLKEDFWVKDSNGKECFFVDKEFFSFGLQFKVLQNNMIQYTVKEKLLKFLPAYEMFDPNGNVVARVKKNFTFLKVKGFFAFKGIHQRQRLGVKPFRRLHVGLKE